MRYESYMASLADGLSDLLTSLWWDRKGEWDRAHRIAQEIEGQHQQVKK